MYPREPRRWKTRFGRWVAGYGVSNIVRSLQPDTFLRVTPNAVYAWLSGHAPHPNRARALVKISGGAIRLQDIYAQRNEVGR